MVRTDTISGGYPSTDRAQSALDWVNSVTVPGNGKSFLFANISSLDVNEYSAGSQANLTDNKNLILNYNTGAAIVVQLQTNCTRAATEINAVQPVLASAETLGRNLVTGTCRECTCMTTVIVSEVATWVGPFF